MTLDTKQKQTLLTVAVLIIVLSVISFWHRPNFVYKDTTDYSKFKFDPQAYQKYLASLQIDPQASRQLFQQIVSQDDIRQAVDQELQTAQPIEPPAVNEADLAVSDQSDQAAVNKYLSDSVGWAQNLNNQTQALNQQLFTQNQQSDQQLLAALGRQIDQLKKIAVPKEAVKLQQDLVSAYLAYQQLAQVSQAYASGQTTDPWASMYQKYAMINNRVTDYYGGLNSLAGKYKLAAITIAADTAQAPSANEFTFIPTAQAVFGLGDTVITIGDIPRIIEQAVADGLTTSFAQFFGSFLQKMIQKIESNYMISNFLYYSDALVQGQYADDYLNKYVSDNLDRQIIKNFIPQFSCGQNQNLQPVFEAKAQQYLGFNPEGLDPADPQFNEKLARVGDFLASPQGWQLYYQDMASQAESAAEKAAEQELLSPGYKTPRDVSKGTIDLSISGIISSQRAAMSSLMNLGISTASNFISKFVGQLTQTLMTQFVFPGASNNGPRSSGNQVGVLKEQATCLAAAQIQPLVPISPTQYTAPGPTPNPNQLLEQQCALYPQLCSPTPTK